jgi:hypothetical protein
MLDPRAVAVAVAGAVVSSGVAASSMAALGTGRYPSPAINSLEPHAQAGH